MSEPERTQAELEERYVSEVGEGITVTHRFTAEEMEAYAELLSIEHPGDGDE